jgi:hypothetical protein
MRILFSRQLIHIYVCTLKLHQLPLIHHHSFSPFFSFWLNDLPTSQYESKEKLETNIHSCRYHELAHKYQLMYTLLYFTFFYFFAVHQNSQLCSAESSRARTE